MNLEKLVALKAEEWAARNAYESAKAAFKHALKEADPDTVDAFYGL